MAIEYHARDGPSNSPFADLPRLLSRFFDQVIELLDARFDLLKAELRETAGNYGRGLAITAVAVIVGLLGFALLNVGVALWLGAVFRNTSLSFAALGFLYLVGGGVVTM